MFINFVNKAITKKEFTNIYLSEILIENYLADHLNYSGISQNEISQIWVSRYNQGVYKKNFAPSYCQRKITQGGGILTYNSMLNVYKIVDTPENLISLQNGELISTLRTIINEPSPIFNTIESFRNTEVAADIFNLVRELLINGNSNDFEVMSYAILSTQLKSMGFSLKRFTATNANDGGVDFIGGDIVYCVTTDLTKSKLIKDINKTHAAKVFIHKNKISEPLQRQIDGFIQEGIISNMINTETLINLYLNQLLKKSLVYSVHLQLRDVITREYQKEIY